MATSYHTSSRMVLDLVRGREQTIRFPAYSSSGTLTAPDAADTVSVLRPDGTALVDAQIITVTGDTATYTLTPAATENLGEGWQVVWNLTLGSESQQAYKQDAALVRQALYPTVTNADLLDEHPEIADLYPSTQTTWMPQISSAFGDAMLFLMNRGRRPWLVLNPWSLHVPVRHLALSKVFRSCSTYTTDGSRYAALAEQYAQMGREALEDIQLTYDVDGDGLPDVGEQQTAGESVLFTSDPPSVWHGFGWAD